METVPMTTAYRRPVINDTPPQKVDMAYWGDVRYDPDDLQPIYIGQHLDTNASTTDINWKIYKYTYLTTNVSRVQLAYGAWDSRLTLF